MKFKKNFSRERKSLRYITSNKESAQRRSKSTRVPPTGLINGIISENPRTFGGTDSGYASTGDDPQRHSYEVS